MEQKLVVVVDGYSDVCDLMKMCLEMDGGVRVVVALDGERGWQIIEQLHPHLVLLSINLPKLDGYQLLDRMRANDRTRNIPVVVVSALPGLRVDGKCNVFDDLVEAPYNIDDLIECVKKHLNVG